ncbi:MAG: hypothetical protein DMD45_13940 [Gemmatimonadetes bacterium]|nr:MAG: hypothetical protein DMD45_13940 [Gemmatimonadota bacterium]
MRKCIGSALLVVVLATVPGLVTAQRRAAAEAGPQNELGVDLAFQYVSHMLNRGSGTRGLMRAPYVTAGVGLNILKFGSGASTETQFAIGGGVGKRLPYGSAVFRPEGCLAYAFSSGVLPSAFSIGIRLGLSFWH